MQFAKKIVCAIGLLCPFLLRGITLTDFAKLKQAEKPTAYATLTPKEKQSLEATNLDILKQYKACPGCYFENITLENLDLSNAKLDQILLKNVKIKSCNLSKASLKDAIILDSELINCNFSQATMENCLIAGSNHERPTVIANCNFSNNPAHNPQGAANSTASLVSHNTHGADIKATTASTPGANLNSAKINAFVVNSNFNDASLVGAQIRRSFFDENTSFIRANMQWLDTDYVEFHGNMTMAALNNSLLKEDDFSAAILTQANLDNTTIIYTRFHNTSADGVSLKGANFVYAVSLRGANFAAAATSPETNLKGAVLCETIMNTTPDDIKKLRETLVASRDQMIKMRNDVYGAGQAACTATQDNIPLAVPTQKCQDFRYRDRLVAAFNEEITKLEQDPPKASIRMDHCGKPLIFHEWQGKDIELVEANKQKLLKNKKCPYCFLEEADLRGTDIHGADLQGAWLGRAVLLGTNLSGSQLQRAYLSGAQVNQATNFSGSILCKTVMPESMYPAGENVRNDTCSAQPTAIEQRSFDAQTTTLTDANTTKAILMANKACPGCDLNYVDFTDQRIDRFNLTNAKMIGTKLANVKAMSANMAGVNMAESDITNADFYQANLSNANLASVTTNNSTSLSFKAANLSGANLSEGNFTNATFEYADLTNIKQAFGAIFTNATFKGAKLNGSDFTGAKFIKVRFQGANIRGTNFNSTDLTDADFSGAGYDANTRFDGATFCRTTMPDGTKRNDSCK